MIQNIGPRCRGGSNRCATTPPSAELGEILSSLLRRSISISSLHTYPRPWFIFKQLLSQQLGNSNLSLPVSIHNLALFIAYLAKSKYSASTVFTYISAIGYVHRLGSFPHPTQSPTVKLALKGYCKLNPSVADSRFPITLPLLEQIINAFSSTVITIGS